MKIILTLDFPEATSHQDLRQRARSLIFHGKINAMVEAKIVNFEIPENQ